MSNIMDFNSENSCCPYPHVHEVLGSTKITGCCDAAHNHRFATVTCNAIPCDGSHVHEVKFRTDSCDGHYHEFSGKTSIAIDVGCGKHVHLIEGHTSRDDDHKHKFIVATLIEDPVCD